MPAYKHWASDAVADWKLPDRRARRVVKPLADDTGCHVPRELYAPLLRAVADRHNIPPGAILGPSQRKIFTAARREFAVLLAQTGRLGVTEIGRIMGRDHSTVSWMIKREKVRAQVREDIATRRDTRTRKIEIALRAEADVPFPDWSGEWAI